MSNCMHCGGALTGKQRKWCSQRCASDGWYNAHPQIKLEVSHRSCKSYRSKNRKQIYLWHHEYYIKNRTVLRQRQKEYNIRNYDRLKAARKLYTKRRCEEFIALIREAKNRPCADCSIKYPYYVMDLDHVRGKKLCHPTKLRNAKSIIKLLEELEKCEPVCANCHRERTHIRGYSNTRVAH